MQGNIITMKFSEVQINFPLEGITFDKIEEMAFDISQEIGRNALIGVMNEIDAKLKSNRNRGELKNKGTRKKYLITRLGDIQYKRTLYKEKLTSKIRYLLEEHLGLQKNQRMSLSRTKMETYLASVFPYREVERALCYLTGHRKSHESIRQEIIREGKKIINHQKKDLRKIKDISYQPEVSAPEVSYIEADATYIKLQKNKKGTKRGNKKSLEVKLGIGYTGKEKRYAKGDEKNKKLKNKFMYAEIGPSKQFMENLSYIAEKRMFLSNVPEVYLGGDGAKWIKTGKEDYFYQAKYVLCSFHLTRNVREALRYRKESQKNILEELRSGEIKKALENLKKIIENSRDEKEKEDVEKLYKYISENKTGIKNSSELSKRVNVEEDKSTGAIESNIDKFISHRFKKRGMSWSEDGAASLIKLKESIVNKEWDEWWNQRVEETKPECESYPRYVKVKRKSEENTTPYIKEFNIPALQGGGQTKPWIEVLRELSRTKREYIN